MRASRLRRIALAATPLCLLVFTHTAVAQEVVAPRPEVPVTPLALQQIQGEETGELPLAKAAAGVSQERQPFQLGPLDLQPHFFYRFLYGNGIQASPGLPVTTIVHQVSPGFLVSVGRYWSLDYTPTWTVYSSRQLRDTLDHNVTFAAGTAYESWILGLSQSYVSSSPPLIETGGQTRQETYSTMAGASYRFNSQMLLELAANQDFRFAEHFVDSHEWSTLDWLNYQFWEGFIAGFGLGLGYLDVSQGADSIYEQMQGRVQWRPTQKLRVEARGGWEDRQFLKAHVDALVNPVFGALIEYDPTEATELSLHASRTVGASYFENQETEATEVRGSVTQRFFRKVYLSVEGGYDTTKYVATASTTLAGRTDDYYTFGVRLSGTILKRLTLAALYERSENTSNSSGFGYSSNQVGVEVSCRY